MRMGWTRSTSSKTVHRLAELELRGMEQGIGRLGRLALVERDQLMDVHPPVLERPAVGGRPCGQFFRGLGQGDVESRLAASRPFEQELERQRGLAGPQLLLFTR